MSDLVRNGELRRRVIETSGTAAEPQALHETHALGLPAHQPASFPGLNLISYGVLIGGGITAAHITVSAFLISGSLQGALAILTPPLPLLLCCMCMMLFGYRLRTTMQSPLAAGGTAQRLRAWHQALRLPFQLRPWHQECSSRIAGLMIWLCQARRFVSGQEEPHRSHLLRCTRNLLGAIDDDPRLRNRVLQLIESHQERWHPPVPVMLEMIANVQRVTLAERGDLPRHTLFRLARGEFRLAVLRALSNQQTPLIDLQLGLHRRLDLPLCSIHSGHVFSMSIEHIDAIGDTVLAFENKICAVQSLNALKDHMARLSEHPRVALPVLEKHPLAFHVATANPHWKKHIESTAAPALDALKKKASDYQSRLETPCDEACPLSEFDYLRSANGAMFLHNHGIAYQEALRAILADKPTSDET